MDSDVDTNDVKLLEDFCVRKIDLTEEKQKRADVTGDGKVNGSDVTQIVSYINGKSSIFDTFS